MKWNRFVLMLIIPALIGMYACKSVETTSAMLHNEHGNYVKAIEMATLAVEKNPLDAQAHFELGISYSKTGEMKRSFEEFLEAKRLDPNKEADAENNIKSNWARHFNQGVAEYQGANFHGASAEFEEATAADPRQIKGWLNLAKVYYQIFEGMFLLRLLRLQLKISNRPPDCQAIMRRFRGGVARSRANAIRNADNLSSRLSHGVLPVNGNSPPEETPENTPFSNTMGNSVSLSRRSLPRLVSIGTLLAAIHGEPVNVIAYLKPLLYPN